MHLLWPTWIISVGSIVQLKEILTKQHFAATSAFDDQFFTYKICSSLPKITIWTEQAFNQFDTQQSIMIRLNHCSNNSFENNIFTVNFKQKAAISHLLWRWCPFSKQHNPKSHLQSPGECQEANFRCHCEASKKCMLHSCHRPFVLWPTFITQFRSGKNLSQLENFSKMSVGANMHHLHVCYLLLTTTLNWGTIFPSCPKN